MHRSVIRSVLSLLAVLGAASLVSAQDATPVRLGETRDGSLTSADPVDTDGSHYDDYLLTVPETQTVRIDLSSTDFDTFLELYRSGGGGLTEVATNDDGGGGLDSRLRQQLDGGGTYVIRVTSYAGGTTGTYTLAVEGSPEVVVTPPRPISDGETLDGVLEPHDPVYEGGHYKDFTFRAEAGSRLRISLDSDVFDTYLFVGRGEGDDFQQLVADDDGGSGVNSAVTWTAPSGGTYTIRASSYQDFTEGPFTVSLQALPDPVTAEPEPYSGDRVDGVLELTDAQGSIRGFGMEETFFDEWTFRGRAGDRVVVSLTSTAFDTFAQIGRGTGDDFEELKSDDDGGANLNSILAIVLPFDGTYTVRVSAVGDMGEGTYSLEIDTLR